MRTSLLSLAVLAAVFIGPPLLWAEDPAATDHQKMLDRSDWWWNQEYASPLYCISQSDKAYGIRIERPQDDHGGLRYSILRDGNTVYSWVGHRRTVFQVVDDRLYYPRYHFSSSGGEVVAVDLTGGNELWRSPLNGLGPVEHSKYLNRMIITVNPDTVTINGYESMGRYIEIKDARTGDTIAHRIYKDEAPSPKSP